jgi:hypothetical protein
MVTRNINCHMYEWVLMKIPRDQTHRAAQRAHGWCMEGALLICGLSDYNTENQTVGHSG